MSEVKDLVNKIQSIILSQYASTVSTNGNLTIITTRLSGFEVVTQIKEYDQEKLNDYYKIAGIVGSWTFISEVEDFFQESIDAYRLLTDTYTDTTANQVWAKRDGCPEGFMRIGMSAGMQIASTDGAMSDETLMSAFYAFANDTSDLAEFAHEHLKPRLDDA